jgi:hypothetical protein
LLTALLTGRAPGVAVDEAGLRGVDRLGEDVGGGRLGCPDDVGVHAERDRWVGVTQPGGDDMNRHAREQQGRGVTARGRQGW